MESSEIINELDGIIAFCDCLKQRATALKKRMGETPSAPRGELSKKAIAEIIGKSRVRSLKQKTTSIIC